MTNQTLDVVQPDLFSPQAMGGAYDAAERHSQTMMMWQPSLQSPDVEIEDEKDISTARVRDTLRNDAYVKSAEQIHKDGVIGSQYVLNAKPDFKTLGLTEEWADAFREEVEAKFMLAADSPNGYFDVTGVNTLTEMLRLGVGVYLSSNEFLASVEWLGKFPNRPFKTAIKLIDTDRLSNPPNKDVTKNIKMGVEKDFYGRPIAYHIRNQHPSDYKFSERPEWKRILATKPWGRPQIIHIFEQDRPDQSRGISQLTSALKELRITKKFRDVTLQNAVVNASFAAAIESELSPDVVFQMMGGSANTSDNISTAINNYATGYMSQIAKYSSNAKNLALDGVKIPHLYPGTKLNLTPAGKGGPLGGEFERSLLRYVASALNLSYEDLANDWSNTNYSSGRMAMNNQWRFFQSRKKKFADRLANTIYRLWLEEMINTNQLTTITPSMPSIYEGVNFDAYAKAFWVGASRGYVDPLKEVQASVLKISQGLSTYEIECQQDGVDYRDIMRQRAKEKKMADDAGLTIAGGGQDMLNALSSTPTDKSKSKDNNANA